MSILSNLTAIKIRATYTPQGIVLFFMNFHVLLAILMCLLFDTKNFSENHIAKIFLYFYSHKPFLY